MKAAVNNMADPVPSVILNKMEKRMKTHPEGRSETNLCACTYVELQYTDVHDSSLSFKQHSVNFTHPKSTNAPPTRKRPDTRVNLTPRRGSCEVDILKKEEKIYRWIHLPSSQGLEREQQHKEGTS